VCLCIIQVPCGDLSNFSKQYPVFSAYGMEHRIEPSDQYDIDNDALLVYKYLKAYDSGRINSLYYPGKIRSDMYNSRLVVG
jgi:hypothetical protein